jgi:hypothetical protein
MSWDVILQLIKWAEEGDQKAVDFLRRCGIDIKPDVVS